MNRKPIFDEMRALLGRGLTQSEVDSMDAAIDAAEGIVVIRPPKLKGRQINAAGERLIKSFEGFEEVAYPDPATGGKPYTVAWGATEDLDGMPFKLGQVVSMSYAEALFDKDTDRFEAAVEKLAPKATDNQFAAMVSLAYNVGLANFEKSTLLKKHNAGDYTGAAAEFTRWNRAAGRVMKGLTRRRAAEADLYRSAS